MTIAGSLRRLKKQLDLFARDPDLTIVGTGMILVTLMDELIETHIRPSSWEWCLQFVAAGGSPFPHSSVVARRDIYQALGGYPADRRFIHCEDYALWADWLRFFKPAMLEEFLRYTVSPYSVSVAARQQQIEGSLRVRERLAGINYTQFPRPFTNLHAFRAGPLSNWACSLTERGGSATR